MKRWLLFCFCAAVFCSCGHRERFPDEPAIEFVRLEKVDNGTNVDNQANLVVHFQDGDGDVGLDEEDTVVFSARKSYPSQHLESMMS